jgi:ParB family chromosome partitioning protein
MRIENAKVRPPSNIEVKSEEKSRPSIFTDKYRGEYYNINVSKLIPFHKQARRNFDEEALQQMAETIKTHGVRQPLTVIPIEENGGTYEIVSGERRLKAAIIAGLKTVPCIIIHDKKAAVEIALIENVQRKDLHPLELAQAYQQLLDEEICANQNDIAKKLGLSRSSVSETMKLLTLPQNVKDHILKENITNRDLFREVLEESDSSQMLDLLKNANSAAKVAFRRIKRKVLLKVVLSNGQICIDTNALSKLSEEDKKTLKQELLSILQ